MLTKKLSLKRFTVAYIYVPEILVTALLERVLTFSLQFLMHMMAK